MEEKRFLEFLLLICTFVAVVTLTFGLDTTQASRPFSTPTPTPFNPFPYQPPTVANKRSYLTLLVGDSMTEVLGPNANQLRLDLIALYPAHEFVNYNYGFGSTNLLSLKERLTQETTYLGGTFPPILKQGFDLIIIESFAYNPLSEYPLEEGLALYRQRLDEAVKLIIKERPEVVVALMTPIAPSQENFAKTTYALSPEQRASWIMERKAYINELVSYAHEKDIPLIDIYSQTQDENGDGVLIYINQDDFIHPSKEGVKFISQAIANFIFENQIFPE